MSADDVYKWMAWFQLPHTFVAPVNPTRNAFFTVARQAKQLPMWKNTLMAKLNYTHAQANAAGTSRAAVEQLILAAPFQ